MMSPRIASRLEVMVADIVQAVLLKQGCQAGRARIVVGSNCGAGFSLRINWLAVVGADW